MVRWGRRLKDSCIKFSMLSNPKGGHAVAALLPKGCNWRDDDNRPLSKGIGILMIPSHFRDVGHTMLARISYSMGTVQWYSGHIAKDSALIASQSILAGAAPLVPAFSIFGQDVKVEMTDVTPPPVGPPTRTPPLCPAKMRDGNPNERSDMVSCVSTESSASPRSLLVQPVDPQEIFVPYHIPPLTLPVADCSDVLESERDLFCVTKLVTEDDDIREVVSEDVETELSIGEGSGHSAASTSLLTCLSAPTSGPDEYRTAVAHMKGLVTASERAQAALEVKLTEQIEVEAELRRELRENVTRLSVLACPTPTPSSDSIDLNEAVTQRDAAQEAMEHLRSALEKETARRIDALRSAGNKDFTIADLTARLAMLERVGVGRGRTNTENATEELRTTKERLATTEASLSSAEDACDALKAQLERIVADTPITPITVDGFTQTTQKSTEIEVQTDLRNEELEAAVEANKVLQEKLSAAEAEYAANMHRLKDAIDVMKARPVQATQPPPPPPPPPVDTECDTLRSDVASLRAALKTATQANQLLRKQMTERDDGKEKETQEREKQDTTEVVALTQRIKELEAQLQKAVVTAPPTPAESDEAALRNALRKATDTITLLKQQMLKQKNAEQTLRAPTLLAPTVQTAPTPVSPLLSTLQDEVQALKDANFGLEQQLQTQKVMRGEACEQLEAQLTQGQTQEARLKAAQQEIEGLNKRVAALSIKPKPIQPIPQIAQISQIQPIQEIPEEGGAPPDTARLSCSKAWSELHCSAVERGAVLEGSIGVRTSLSSEVSSQRACKELRFSCDSPVSGLATPHASVEARVYVDAVRQAEQAIVEAEGVAELVGEVRASWGSSETESPLQEPMLQADALGETRYVCTRCTPKVQRV